MGLVVLGLVFLRFVRGRFFLSGFGLLFGFFRGLRFFFCFLVRGFFFYRVFLGSLIFRSLFFGLRWFSQFDSC